MCSAVVIEDREVRTYEMNAIVPEFILSQIIDRVA